MQQNSSTRPHLPVVYFENLNSIRFIAAFLIIIHHIEQYKYILHLPNVWKNEAIFSLGKLGVILFFVLSGFLISYLLYKEKHLTHTISIKDFYIRRIFRIWPLYFLILFLAFFIIPHINMFLLAGNAKNFVPGHLAQKLFLYIFFMPNLALTLYGPTPFCSHTWSIGAEEQFYILWPNLIKRFKNMWLLLFAVIIIYILIKFLILLLPNDKTGYFINDFWLSTPIDSMAIGGVFALIIFKKDNTVKKIQKIVFNKALQWTVLLLTILFISKGVNFKHFQHEVYSVLFGILICNFAFNPNRIFSLEYPVFNYLGKISYGLYMYHSIAIVLMIKILMAFNLANNISIFFCSFSLLVFISALSYELFEKKFILNKIKYSKLLTGDNLAEVKK